MARPVDPKPEPEKEEKKTPLQKLNEQIHQEALDDPDALARWMKARFSCPSGKHAAGSGCSCK